MTDNDGCLSDILTENRHMPQGATSRFVDEVPTTAEGFVIDYSARPCTLNEIGPSRHVEMETFDKFVIDNQVPLHTMHEVGPFQHACVGNLDGSAVYDHANNPFIAKLYASGSDDGIRLTTDLETTEVI